MGRQSVVVSSRPAAAPPPPPPATMPPMPPRPPKKRYLMENPPRIGGVTEMSAPPSGDRVSHSLAAPSAAALASNGVNGSERRVSEQPEPLNLTTAPNTEVHLSSIVDKVVERMLKRNEADSGQGDPLRLWFTNQFETRGDGGSPGPPEAPAGPPGGHSGSPRPPGGHSGSPRPAGGRSGSPQPAGRPRSASPPPAPPGSSSAPDRPERRNRSDSGGPVVELTIGMSETISRVIDSVYRREDEEAADAARLGQTETADRGERERSPATPTHGAEQRASSRWPADASSAAAAAGGSAADSRPAGTDHPESAAPTGSDPAPLSPGTRVSVTPTPGGRASPARRGRKRPLAAGPASSGDSAADPDQVIVTDTSRRKVGKEDLTDDVNGGNSSDRDANGSRPSSK